MDESFFPRKPDGEREASVTVMARNRASAFAFVLLVLAIVFAGLGITDTVGQQWSDISKVVAVAFFVGAMFALAMGMIGGAYHQR